MASIASASPSSHSFQGGAESGDDSESWQYLDSNAASVGFFPSPASGSLQSWGVVGYTNQLGQSPPAVSPLRLDIDQHGSSASLSDQPDLSMMIAPSFDGDFPSGFSGEQVGLGGDPSLFNDQLNSILDMSSCYNTGQDNVGNLTDLEGLDISPQPVDLGIPSQFRNDGDIPPWDPTNLNHGEGSFFMNEFKATTPPLASEPSPVSYVSSSNPKSPSVTLESEKAPDPIRKIRGSGKVEKKRAEPASKFVIMTPNLISASAGKPNLFECFDAMRTTQRGRKGPLANDTKESALVVRRLGACFCCHSRKVKCDKERPCRACTKMAQHVPQIVCWQFSDFVTILFPDFIRGHLKKEEMAKFMSDNIESFTDNVCQVELFSGSQFQSTLTLKSTFFQPRGLETLSHWHMNVGVNQIDLQQRGSVPIGIDLSSVQLRDKLKKKTRDYIQSLTFEPQYAEQVTDSFRHTDLPRKIVKIVQRFGQQSDSPMVKKALSIMTMHYVMTRHLCITNTSIMSLQHTGLVPQAPWVTPRVLSRQVKSIIDEMLLREVRNLFDSFSKSLKPKSRKEWAPCLASFLILCMIMEAIETAADMFIISENEINIRNRLRPQYQRTFALQINKEIENMPFKQFAYQFHQIYQTHTKDASTKAFNPLQDDSFAQQGHLDRAALEMVTGLKELLQGDSYYELDFLCADPILPNHENHPFPRDISFNYTGRLLARFMLSFLDEKYLFDGQY